MDNEALMMTIAVLGGTGKEGKGLAYRWAKAGYQVLIGSRSSEKAVTAASEIMELLDGAGSVVGTSNLEAARQADIVVLTVPYSAHRDTLESVKEEIKGKLFIDVTVPLVPPKVTKVQMPAPVLPPRKQRRSLVKRWKWSLPSRIFPMSICWAMKMLPAMCW